MTIEIPLDQIIPNPEQPRTSFDAAELAELAASIQLHGVIQAISVEAAGDHYILEDGERRWRAAKLAGLTTIPATVVPSRNGNGPQARLERALVANLQRSDMNPIEEARSYAQLRDRFRLSHREIAVRVGKPEVRIALRLALLEGDPEIQALIAAGRLSKDPRVTKALMQISDRPARLALAQRIVDRKLTLSGAIKAAERVAAALAKTETISAGSAPAFRVGGVPEKTPLRWQALAQVGAVPDWSELVKSVYATCDNCVLREIANKTVCAECGLVGFLRDLTRRTA